MVLTLSQGVLKRLAGTQKLIIFRHSHYSMTTKASAQRREVHLQSSKQPWNTWSIPWLDHVSVFWLFTTLADTITCSKKSIKMWFIIGENYNYISDRSEGVMLLYDEDICMFAQ